MLKIQQSKADYAAIKSGAQKEISLDNALKTKAGEFHQIWEMNNDENGFTGEFFRIRVKKMSDKPKQIQGRWYNKVEVEI